jgi:hypothetical protein
MALPEREREREILSVTMFLLEGTNSETYYSDVK